MRALPARVRCDRAAVLPSLASGHIAGPYIKDFQNVSLVFQGLTHASDMATAAKLFGAKTPGGISAAGLVEVLECTPHSSTKMDILRAVSGHVYGSKDVVIAALTHSSDKEEAARIL